MGPCKLVMIKQHDAGRETKRAFIFWIESCADTTADTFFYKMWPLTANWS